MVSKNYYKLAYYNFVKQSHYYIFINNFKLYISQFFKYFFSVCKNLLNTFTIVIPSICQNAKESRLNKIRFYNLASLILDCHASRCVPNGNSRNDDKNNFAILITRWLQPLVLTIHKKASQCNCTQWVKTHCYSGYAFSYALKNNFAILNLVKSFLTSITFDSLSRKIKILCLVINKFIFLRRIFV